MHGLCAELNSRYVAEGLDTLQRGHLRRILNLSSQLPDDWSGMMGRSSLQEDYGAYRFQLAYMAYALALAHVHRLPAARGYFRRPFARLIEKMRSPDVWTYWHYVSTGNGPNNKGRGPQPPQWDPVVRDNIMYSAYLQSMALLYHYLFNDDRYARKNGLSLVYQPLYWGEEKRFDYDEASLNDHIYWSMVESGYLGIACEPNCVFQICNQVPIIGFRLHDLVYGGDTAREVTEGYLRAWAEFGILNNAGHFNMFLKQDEGEVVAAEEPWSDFWLGALMHAWNPELVKTQYPKQVARWMQPGPGDTLWVASPESLKKPDQYVTTEDFGWATVCASEVGDIATRDRLLTYADTYLHPRWADGGYHYARHDQLMDGDGLYRFMTPHTGNALLAYARLNVPDGLRGLYEGVPGPAHHDVPAIEDLDETLDVTRAYFDPRERCLHVRLEGASVDDAFVAFAGVWQRGAWTMHLDGQPIAQGTEDAVIGGSDRVAVQRISDHLEMKLNISDAVELRIQWQ